jgi:hypothetical protein
MQFMCVLLTIITMSRDYFVHCINYFFFIVVTVTLFFELRTEFVHICYTELCSKDFLKLDDLNQCYRKLIKSYINTLNTDVQLKSGPYFNMSNLFTKIYNMLHYTTNLYLQ